MNTTFNKAIVSVVMGILIILEQLFGFHVAELSEEAVTIILSVIWALLVYFVPNADA